MVVVVQSSADPSMEDVDSADEQEQFRYVSYSNEGTTSVFFDPS